MEQKISDLLNKTFSHIMNFLLDDEDIRRELMEHILESKEEDEKLTQVNVAKLMQKALYSNYFLYTKDKEILDYYLENNPELTEDEKQLLECLKNHRLSVFKIMKKHKDYFELYRLTSEVLYEVYPLEKMSDFRDVNSGDYVLGVITKFKDKYYLIDVEGFMPASERGGAMTAAFMEITVSTESYYEDNPENLEKAETMARQLNEIFVRHFGSEPVITTKNCSIDIINSLNSYILDNDTETIKTINVERPEAFGYFEKDTDEEDEESFKLPVEQDINYDVGLFVDPELGLFKIPYYGTFREIFFTEDTSAIENYGECLYNLFRDDTTPPSAIMHVYNEVNDRGKFLSIIKEPLWYDEPPEVEELLRLNKPYFFRAKRFSFVVINLISSFIEEFKNELFKTQQEVEKEKEIQISGKIGRNDPCPCGSGKKYKKCCLK